MSVVSVKASYPIIPQIPDQDEFAEKMLLACDQVWGLIQGGTKFVSLIEQIGVLVGGIAEEMKREHASNFGKLRKTFHDRVSTPLIGPYKEMEADLSGLSADDPSIKWETFTEGYRSGFRLGKEGEENTVHLTRYIYCPAMKSTLAHTYPNNIQKAVIVMTGLYQSLMEKPQDLTPADVLTTIAKIHWWFVQTAPYFRGSASGGELLASALHKHIFKTHIYWKEGVLPDRIALMTSENEFVKLYPTLLQSDLFGDST